MAKTSYLRRLPKTAQKTGDASRGEIEIVTGRKESKRIEADCAGELDGSALGKGGKRIGILLEDKVHLFVRDAVRFPSGATGCQMRVIGLTQFDGVNGVVALAYRDGKFVLRSIYRHATRSWELETVSGRREAGQTSRAAARKEIREELGYPVRRLVSLGRICPESALMASTLDVFWADLGAGPRKDHPEPKEAFGPVESLTPQEIADRIASREIRDGYTISALMLAQLAGIMMPLPSRGA